MYGERAHIEESDFNRQSTNEHGSATRPHPTRIAGDHNHHDHVLQPPAALIRYSHVLQLHADEQRAVQERKLQRPAAAAERQKQNLSGLCARVVPSFILQGKISILFYLPCNLHSFLLLSLVSARAVIRPGNLLPRLPEQQMSARQLPLPPLLD